MMPLNTKSLIGLKAIRESCAFNELNWNMMLDEINVYEFFDGIILAVTD